MHYEAAAYNTVYVDTRLTITCFMSEQVMEKHIFFKMVSMNKNMKSEFIQDV
jgi:hypothetical protein